MAQNFARHGVLDIELAPDIWGGRPYLLQATGYPVLLPLAGAFKLLGSSFTVARVYMVIWLFAAVLLSFWFIRKFFNEKLAAGAVLLLTGFPTVYGVGRTVLGEVPGFALTLLGLYLFLEKKNSIAAGAMFGLAAVAKPSVFLLLIPTLIVLFFMRRGISFTDLSLIAIGMFPPAFFSFLFIRTNPLDPMLWTDVLNFYRNPFFGSDPALNMASNLSHFFEATTLIYFSFLWLLLLAGSFLVRQPRISFLYRFVLIYSLFAFVYYLRSPGYLRYIFPAELFILMLSPYALLLLFEAFKNRIALLPKVSAEVAALLFVALLSGVHFIHLFTGADISSGDSAIKTAQYLDEEYAEKSVAVLGDISVYTLLQNPKRSVVIEAIGSSVLGSNPLLSLSLPEVVVAPPGSRFFKEGAEIIEGQYIPAEPAYGFEIYELR